MKYFFKHRRISYSFTIFTLLKLIDFSHFTVIHLTKFLFSCLKIFLSLNNICHFFSLTIFVFTNQLVAQTNSFFFISTTFLNDTSEDYTYDQNNDKLKFPVSFFWNFLKMKGAYLLVEQTLYFEQTTKLIYLLFT